MQLAFALRDVSWWARTAASRVAAGLSAVLAAAGRNVVAVDLKRLERVELAGTDGRRHRLGDFWAERPVILVFLRHFG